MSRVLDWLGDAVIGVLNFFINISATPGEDPVFAEYKRLQRACVGSLCGLALLVGMGFIVGHLLNSLQESPLGQALDGMRKPIGYGFLGLTALASAYAAYAWFALVRFLRSSGEQ